MRRLRRKQAIPEFEHHLTDLVLDGVIRVALPEMRPLRTRFRADHQAPVEPTDLPVLLNGEDQERPRSGLRFLVVQEDPAHVQVVSGLDALLDTVRDLAWRQRPPASCHDLRLWSASESGQGGSSGPRDLTGCAPRQGDLRPCRMRESEVEIANTNDVHLLTAMV